MTDRWFRIMQALFWVLIIAAILAIATFYVWARLTHWRES